jgi:hypothetical protein
MKVIAILCVAFLNACPCVPAKWLHNGQRCSGLYVRDASWNGGGYMTWKRCDESGVWYWDFIPISLASDVRLVGIPNEVRK